jgi:isopenicillin N synthase-like dioxygenase
MTGDEVDHNEEQGDDEKSTMTNNLVDEDSTPKWKRTLLEFEVPVALKTNKLFKLIVKEIKTLHEDMDSMDKKPVSIIKVDKSCS